MEQLKEINFLAQRLSISKARAYALIGKGVFSNRNVIVRVGRKIRVNPQELETWIENGGNGLSRPGPQKITREEIV